MKCVLEAMRSLHHDCIFIINYTLLADGEQANPCTLYILHKYKTSWRPQLFTYYFYHSMTTYVPNIKSFFCHSKNLVISV